ncbi:hypothetical protein ACFVAE_14620 [Microbacterium sp. NPDC057659]|uniref:hypothetical protein n=1 Tax=Microbacterium sp. NPDC057659 TaxID=3346198 RepID=UPI003671E83B
MSKDADRREAEQIGAGTGVTAGIGYLLLQAVASYAGFLILVMSALSIAGCGDSCDYALAGASMQAQIWGSVVLWILSAIAVTWRALLRRTSWWVPLVGIGAVALLTIGTSIAMDIATPTLGS